LLVSQPTASRSSRDAAVSGIRRIAVRVPADFTVVVARSGGEKLVARVSDISISGMHLEAPIVPEYGERITVVLRFSLDGEWLLLPALVRWFSKLGFGVAFRSLDERRTKELGRFVRSLRRR
jgi:hypothetical protein